MYKKLEKFYVWGIKILIYLIPFLPLFIAKQIVFPYVTGKSFAFRILVELATVLWLGLIVLNKEYRPKNSVILSAVLFFTFVVGLADIFGVNPYGSFWSSFERMDGYITILHLMAYFVIVTSVLITKKDWKIFLNIFVIAAVPVCMYALFQRFGHEGIFRVFSTLGNPPFLAGYLILILFVGLVLLSSARSKFLKSFYCPQCM